MPPKRLKEVVAQLDQRGFHFGNNATQKALQRAPFLRGEGKGRGSRYHRECPLKVRLDVPA